MLFKKVMAMVLATVMVLGVVTSCSSKTLPDDTVSNADNTITIESFEADEAVRDVEEETNELGQFYKMYESGFGEPELVSVGYSNKSVCFFDNKFCLAGTEFDYEYSMGYVCLKIFDCETGEYELHYVASVKDHFFIEAWVFVFNGSLWVAYTDYELTNICNIVNFDINQVDSVDLSESPEGSYVFGSLSELISSGFSIESVYAYDGGVCFCLWGDECEKLAFIGEDGSETVIETTEFDGLGGCRFIDYSDEYFVMIDDFKTLIIDRNTFDVISCDDSDLQSPVDLKHMYTVQGVDELYVNSYEGLYTYNPSTNSSECLFDYNCVIGDASVFADSYYITDYDGSSYFYAQVYNLEEETMELKIVTVTPTENPYTNRQIIKLACSDLSSGFVKNIKEFNDNNSDYFVEYRLINDSVPNRLSLSETRPYYINGGDATSYYKGLKFYSELEAKQYAYIKKNDFDLIFGFGTNALFDSSRMCLDLNEYITEEDKANLYTNVYEANEQDGKLYQLPLTFAVNAIVYAYGDEINPDSSIYDEAGVSPISFDEYMELAETTEEDPFHEYVSNYECFDRMVMNEFTSYIGIDSRTCDFGSDYFRKIFDYSFAYVAEIIDSEFTYSAAFSGKDFLGYTQLNSVADFSSFWYFYKEAYSYYSIPTANGDGLTATLEDTIAIVNDTERIDGSVEFVRFLISDYALPQFDAWNFQLNKSVNNEKQRNLSSFGFEFGYSPEETHYQLTEECVESINRFEHKDDIISEAMIAVVAKEMRGQLIDGSDSAPDVDNIINMLNHTIKEILNKY